jgi:hypothetical protein
MYYLIAYVLLWCIQDMIYEKMQGMERLKKYVFIS